MESTVNVCIEAGSTARPVSKRLYGVSLDHASCGDPRGLLAEMLLDRRFCHPVGDARSPWRIVSGSVEMMTSTSFAGEYAPALWPPCAVAQGGLHLLRGREYVGRAVLCGVPGDGPTEVSLEWGAGQRLRSAVLLDVPSRDYATHTFSLVAGEDTADGRFVIATHGRQRMHVGALSLMPADNVDGLRNDVLELLHELHATLYRWPGDGSPYEYDWRDSVGEPDRRPPRADTRNRADVHDFGPDEFLRLCRLLEAEPCIAVDCGEGNRRRVVQEVEYLNGSPGTTMGRKRARNGHADPYEVVRWLLCDDPQAVRRGRALPSSGEDSLQRQSALARAMRAADPAVTLIGMGDDPGIWSEPVLRNRGDFMDLICVRPEPVSETPRAVSCGPAESIGRLARRFRALRRTFSDATVESLHLAFDTWQDAYAADTPAGPCTLEHALAVAAAFNQLIRDSDVVRFATLLPALGARGGVTASETQACMSAAGLVLALYRSRFGAVPVEMSGDADPLDIVAAWTEDGRAVTVAVVNANDTPVGLLLQIEGAQWIGRGRMWTLTGPERGAFNEPGLPPAVRIEEEGLAGLSIPHTVPPWTLSVLELATRAADDARLAANA